MKIGSSLVSKEVAMVFHAAMRLYGEENLRAHLANVQLRHERYLGELCLECGLPTEDKENAYCSSCRLYQEAHARDLGLGADLFIVPQREKSS